MGEIATGFKHRMLNTIMDAQNQLAKDMQSRRNEDFASESSYGRGRRNTDHGPDSYLMMSPHSKRSWSPRRMEGPSYSERVLSGHRGASMERRRLVDDGSRRIRSRSPPFLEAKRGGSFYNDDWAVHRDSPTSERRPRYDFFDRMDMKHVDVDSPPRNEFGYGRGSSRTAITDDKFEGRRLDSGMNDMVSRKSAVTGLYRSNEQVGPTSRTESSRDLSSASFNIGLDQPGKERFRYPDVRDLFSFEKYTDMKQYRDGDKDMVHPRDTSYSNLTSSRSKESMGASHMNDYARTSPRKSRADHIGYRGGSTSGIPLPRDNHPLNSANIADPLSPSRYEQRQHLDLHRDPYLEFNEDMPRYHRETFSPPRTKHLDSLHLQPRTRERDDYLYPSDDIYEKMDMRERVDYNNRDTLKPHLSETSDFSHRNMSSRTSLDYLSLQNQTATNISLSRSPGEGRETAHYLDPDSVHSRLGRKISREHENSYMGMTQDREIERVRVDYDYKRDIGTGSSLKERRGGSRSPRFSYEMERLRPSERTHNMEDHDLSPYDSSSRFLKRKYTMGVEENRIINRRHNQVQDFSDEEWIKQDTKRSDFTKRRNHDHDHDLDHHHHTHGFSRRVEKFYDEADQEYDEWYSSQDLEELMHDHHHEMKSYKYEDKYAKGYSRSGGRGGYNNSSYNQNRRNVVSKWKTVQTRSEIDEIESYEHWGPGSKSEPQPPEDSQGFKKLVHGYFLTFTKKLNDMPGVRRRYMEQGRAGSLFCIVCGRSLSKEFMDTQRLAMHAFMSRKVGLRAQHLGLHKAICVMLGWNGSISQENIRWFPEPLSTTESLILKEDLIIWPPVVIVHNNGEGPTTVEELGQFLRGKGLSGGKVKFGKSGNSSIMLVKFLGTFSGLQEAEKIHEYFLKNKHGRKDFEHISSSKGKNKDEREGECVVFGYMGIAEDLDKVDFDTKRKCSIKSKKEIKDIADAPVKPE